MVSFIDKLRSTPKRDRLFRQEELVLDVTETICQLMKQQGVSRKGLALRMGMTKSQVNHMLSGETDITLRTLSDIFAVLGRKVSITCDPCPFVVKLPDLTKVNNNDH